MHSDEELAIWRRRCHAWQTVDGEWVSGRDVLRWQGTESHIDAEAQEIEPDMRRHYRLLVRWERRTPALYPLDRACWCDCTTIPGQEEQEE